MQLGNLMKRLSSEKDAAEALAALGNLALFAEVESMGARHGETPGEYLSAAAGRFAARASDEEWLALMNAIERSEDPSRAALEKMLRWALAADEADERAESAPAHAGCTCGGGGACHGSG